MTCSPATPEAGLPLGVFKEVWLDLPPSHLPICGSSQVSLGFPGGSDGKEYACHAGEPCLVPGSRRFPWRRAWQPTPIFLPGESHGQRSLMGYIQSMGSQRVRRDWATNHTHLPHVGPALCPSQLGPSFCLLLRARAMGIRPQGIRERESWRWGRKGRLSRGGDLVWLRQWEGNLDPSIKSFIIVTLNQFLQTVSGSVVCIHDPESHSFLKLY